MKIRNYTLLNELGRGTFGVTYLGLEENNNKKVAIKTIDIAKSKELGVDISAIDDEIQTMKELSKGGCPKHIACFYESFVDDMNGISTMFIISEYIEGGSLTDFINSYNGNMPIGQLWPIMLQLILGLKYIHDRGYAHRDIKPDNILITNDLTIKYIDFGLACLEKCRILTCTNTCKGAGGTLLYMPPEFFNNTRVDSLNASQAHDVWSLLMVFYELSNGPYMFPYITRSQDGLSFLSTEEIIMHISNAPEYLSNYNFDDGRTNIFLNESTVSDWRSRPTINILLSQYINDILSPVWS